MLCCKRSKSTTKSRKLHFGQFFRSPHCIDLCLLPTAYVVRGKVMFWHVSVHPSVCLQGGVPQSGPAWRGYPSQVQLGDTPAKSSQGVPWSGPVRQVPKMGYPHRDGQVRTGRYPTWGNPTLPGMGLSPLPPPPGQDSIWSTWYAVVGMPLAFTQEDFLVFLIVVRSLRSISILYNTKLNANGKL